MYMVYDAVDIHNVILLLGSVTISLSLALFCS